MTSRRTWRRVRCAALSTALTAGLLGLGPAPAPQAAPAAGELTPVIVQLTGSPAVAALPRGGEVSTQSALVVDTVRRQLLASQNGFVANAQRSGLAVRDARHFATLVNAVALRVPANQVATLSRLPGVAGVYPDSAVTASTADSVPLIGAPQVWERQDGAGRPATGTGVTVAVVDTGVDYSHPDLGGGFGEGHKVVAGYDFVNNDPDPMDDNAHGTHVAGIIAGGGAPPGVTGVAPGATLTAYKVLDDFGRGTLSQVMAGLEAAVDPANPHRADVVNMSLGAPGDGTDPLGQAATNAVRSGVVVVAAAGNAGPGEQTLDSPGSAEGVLTVGASVSGLRLPTAYLASPKDELLQSYRVPFSANPPEQPVTADVVDVGRGMPEDYDRVGDVTGKVVLYEGGAPASSDRVSTFDLDLAREAEKRGAVAAIGYVRVGSGPVLAADEQMGAATEPDTDTATAGGEIAGRPHGLASGDDLRMERLVMLGMDGDQYDELAGLLGKGQVRIRIEGADATDAMASFSSRGPTGTYRLEPEIVAPGWEIRSTIPKALWPEGYFRFSGTSMATPHVAGAAALLRQLRPNDDPAAVSGALVGSSTSMERFAPSTVGAGRLDVDAAARSVLAAQPATVSLGLADLSRSTVGGGATVTVRNTGADPVSATLRTQSAPGSAGTATVSPSQLTIPASGSATVTVKVSAPRPGADTDLTGWVVADVAGDAPDLRVPYLMSVRPLIVQVSPDPSDGTTSAFVSTPTPLAGPPVITVTPRFGRPFTVPARLDHGTWYRADIAVDDEGTYRVGAAAWAGTGQRLVGAGSFEVVPPANRSGRTRWEAVGPNANSGQLSTTPARGGQAVMTQYQKAGLWITTDKGATWTQANRLPVAGGTGTAVIDPRNGDRMWYAVNGSTGGFFGTVVDPTYQGKMLRTEDRGQTWRTLDFPDQHISALAVDGSGRTLAAVTGNSVMVSHDRGQTWTGYPTAWTHEPDNAVIAGGDLYVNAFDGVWAMRDVTGDPQPLERVYDGSAGGDAHVIGMDADDDMVVLARGGAVIMGSRDGGRNWEELYDAPTFGGITVRVAGGDIFFSSYFEDYIGRDHGATWEVKGKPVNGPVDVDYDRWPGDPSTELVSAERGGLFATRDQGGSFSRLGVQGLTVYDLAVSQDAEGRPMLTAGTVSGYYRTALPTGRSVNPEWGLSGKEGWIGTTDEVVQAWPADPTVVWRIRKTAIQDFYIERSADGGATWQTRGRTYEFPGAIYLHPTDPDRVAVAFGALDGAGLYVTKDGGASWKRLYHGMSFDVMSADPAHPDRMWLGNASGLYRSDDGGITLTRVLAGRVGAVSVDRSGRIVAGGDEIRVSTDGGRTFRTAESGGLGMRVAEIVARPDRPRELYAATTSHSANGLLKGGRGVLRSTDGGLTWVNISGGLQNTAVTNLALSPDGRWLFAGTVDGGVHRLRL